MSYTDFEKYYEEKLRQLEAQSARRKAQQSRYTTSQARSKMVGVYRTSPTKIAKKTDRKPLTKAQIKQQEKEFKKACQSALIFFLATVTIATSSALFNRSEATTSVPSEGVGRVESNVLVGNQITNNISENKLDKLSESHLLDYKSYCYYSNYGDEQYLYCPEQYVLQIAEYAIEKINNQFGDAGKMNPQPSGRFVPDCITPELITAFCMTESSYRVEDSKGIALGGNRDRAWENNAIGIMQQKPGFVTDANNYSKAYGGGSYSAEDRENPLTAIEMSVLNLTRIYNAYLTSGKNIYNSLAKDGISEKELLGALIIAYNQGEGAMSNWAKSGVLSEVLENPNCTDKYGASYLRSVTGYMNEIINRYSNEMDRN